MKIYYLQNENKEITQDDFERFDENCKEIEKDEYRIINGYNGALFFVDYTQTEEYKCKAEQFQAEHKLRELRQRREMECFSVINRGTLWYERITAEQREELETWYQAWLDVTETGIAPAKPEWVNEEFSKRRNII